MSTDTPPDERPAQDVELRERAFVDPDDVKQLGAPENTMEKIEMMLERVKAQANTPDSFTKAMLKFAPYIILLAMGWWFGREAAGGGGGGGSGSEAGSSASSVTIDFATTALEATSRAPALAMDAGMGVV